MIEISGRDTSILCVLAMLPLDVAKDNATLAIDRIDAPYAKEVARALTGLRGRVSANAKIDAAGFREWAETLDEAPALTGT